MMSDSGTSPANATGSPSPTGDSITASAPKSIAHGISGAARRFAGSATSEKLPSA